MSSTDRFTVRPNPTTGGWIVYDNQLRYGAGEYESSHRAAEVAAKHQAEHVASTADEQRCTRLTEAGPQWPAVARTLDLEVVMVNDEWQRDRVRSPGGPVYYRVELTGRWHRQGWSDASAARLQRDTPLSVLAGRGAGADVADQQPTGTDDDRS